MSNAVDRTAQPFLSLKINLFLLFHVEYLRDCDEVIEIHALVNAELFDLPYPKFGHRKHCQIQDFSRI